MSNWTVLDEKSDLRVIERAWGRAIWMKVDFDCGNIREGDLYVR